MEYINNTDTTNQTTNTQPTEILTQVYEAPITPETPKTKINFRIISLVLGIVSVIGVFIFGSLIVPIAIVGIILGVIHKKQTNKKSLGLYLSIIGIIISILINTLTPWFLPKKSLTGKWMCGSYDGVSPQKYPYSVNFNKNNIFSWYAVDDKNTLNIEGTYTVTRVNNENEYKRGTFYTVEMSTNNRTVSGETHTDTFNITYNTAVVHNEMVLTNINNLSLYFCIRKGLSLYSPLSPASKTSKISLPSPTPVPTITSTTDSPVEWLTFNNEKFHFETEYPSNLKTQVPVKMSNGDGWCSISYGFFVPKDTDYSVPIKITIYYNSCRTNEELLSLYDFTDSKGQYLDNSVQKTTISDLEAITVKTKKTWLSGGLKSNTSMFTNTLIKNNDYTFIIEGREGYESIYNHMLESLKFN